MLVEKLGIRAAVTGYDFHFGKARRGTPQFLADQGALHGFSVTIVECDGGGGGGGLRHAHPRGAGARRGRPGGKAARLALRRRRRRSMHGEKRGRELGYPTANMALDPASELAQRHLCGAVPPPRRDRSSTGWRATAGGRPSAAARRCSKHSSSTFPATSTARRCWSPSMASSGRKSSFERGGAGGADGAGFDRRPGAARANAGRGAGSERLPGVGEGVKWRSSRQARRAAPQAGWLTPSHSASPID